MKMHVIATTIGDDWAGPFTDLTLAKKILAIIQRIDPDAEIISRESDPYREQIEAGMRPYQITVDIIGGEPQLPAAVSPTWPPAEQEGIQKGTPEGTTYFIWAKSERDALIRLVRLNRAAPPKMMEAA